MNNYCRISNYFLWKFTISCKSSSKNRPAGKAGFDSSPLSSTRAIITGVSYEYGYPLGKDLKTAIIESIGSE